MDLIVPSDRAREMAEELAARLGQSVSAVVEHALEEKLASVPSSGIRREKLTLEERQRLVREIIQRSGPTPLGATSDHSSLYDEDGLPA